MKIYLVQANGLVLSAYVLDSHAQVHARTVTGAMVAAMDLRTQVPSSVSEDAASDDWDEEPTPVQEPKSDITKTQPSTPRAKTKSRPPEGR